MAYWTSAAAQVKALAKAVSAAFAASNLAEDEKSPGKIEISDLAWQAPPLLTPLVLSGGALQDYFDAPVDISEAKLLNFWGETLQDMWYRPSTLLRKGVIANCARAMPAVRQGQRAFRFSRPTGWPVCEEFSGVMFSLEVAQAARASLPVRDIEQGGDTYVVETAAGTRFGVENGLPLLASPWVAPARGLVPDLLTMPRGDAVVHCDFDQIASLRSVLHVHRARFPKNFEALDYALQALRLLSQGQHCPELLQRMRVAPLDMALARAKERALFDSLDVVDAPNLSDRARLQTVYARLVPDVISASVFRRAIFAGDQYPFTLARGKLNEIRNWLISQYQQLPVELQKGEYAISKT